MFPANRLPIPVAVEYTSGNRRVVKQFPNQYKARKFYLAKDLAGAEPKLVAIGANVMSKQDESANNGHRSGLTGNETKILAALVKGNKPMSREQLRKATGINKGWSKTLGSSTKEGLGMSGKESLEGRGLVRSQKQEGERVLTYTVTPKGKAELARATKAK